MASRPRFIVSALALLLPALAHAQDPAANDWDGDGVLNAQDSCPFVPNPAVGGVQPQVCGAQLNAIISNHTFLRSRTLPKPASGSIPAPAELPQGQRVHVLLHVVPSPDGVVLRAARRQTLQNLGVNVLGYLPRDTYYASLPRDLLAQVVGLDFVRAISAIKPADRVAPDLRVRGPLVGLNANGTVDVDVTFFDDATTSSINAAIAAGAQGSSLLYDKTYRLRLAGAGSVAGWAARDIVQWIEDGPDAPVDETSNGQAATGADLAIAQLGLTGAGITVSMVESGVVGPVPLPGLAGRVTQANFPALANFSDHARKVASIMIADSSSGFPSNAGLLPQATLVGYATPGLTVKRQHYGVTKEAREDYGALLTNNSWGTYNCAKVGEYTKRSKFLDKAVYEVGTNVIKSSGNGRNGNFFVTSTPFSDCVMDLYSLTNMSAAKNAIVVGNMVVGSQTIGAISGSSSAGPTADGRLKPDVMAPGNGLLTIGYNSTTGVTSTASFSGTSAASPFVGGVVGLIGETFLDNGVDPLTVPPARYRAILAHTARDVGVAGPDFRHGYGLVQPESAVRIADEWALWGREGVLDETTTFIDFTFDVSSPHTAFKVTLAWDDEHGEESSTMALKNDLDLVLYDPSNNPHYPYDLTPPPPGSTDPGAVPCMSATCADRRNNLEMVLALPPAGDDRVEAGLWRAEITVARLVSTSQRFSLVLTPSCPVNVTASLTLDDPVTCSASTVQNTGILVTAPNVVLDCANQLVSAPAVIAGSRGIVSQSDNVTIRNCAVQQFDHGIVVDPGVATNVLTLNDVSLVGSRGISLSGRGHSASVNTISQMLSPTGVGIWVDGDQMQVTGNDLGFAYSLASGASTTGVQVQEASTACDIEDNRFSGLWRSGIVLLGTQTGTTTATTFNNVLNNIFQGIDGSAIVLDGDVDQTSISGNTIDSYALAFPGQAASAIVVRANARGAPSDTTVTGNTVHGDNQVAQRGIELRGADGSNVTDNLELTGLGRGIIDDQTTSTLISGNRIINPIGFVGWAGIESSESDGSSNGHVMDNVVVRMQTGIALDKPGNGSVDNNEIGLSVVGIAVTDADPGLWLRNNIVEASAVGISASRSPSVSIFANVFQPPTPGAGTAIAIDQCSAAVLGANEASAPSTGIAVTSSDGVVMTSNTVSAAGVAAFRLSAVNDLFAAVNDVLNNASVGFALASGSAIVLDSNTVTSVGAGLAVRLGDNLAATCADDLYDVELVANVFTGGAVDPVAVMCDVGSYTITP